MFDAYSNRQWKVRKTDSVKFEYDSIRLNHIYFKINVVFEVLENSGIMGNFTVPLSPCSQPSLYEI